MIDGLRVIDRDEQWLSDHKDRQSLIRIPFGGEMETEFQSLGPHQRDRRRIIVWKVPRDNKMAPGKVVRLPLLAFADEEISNDDKTLLPIIHEIMMDAANKYGIAVPRPKLS